MTMVKLERDRPRKDNGIGCDNVLREDDINNNNSSTQRSIEGIKKRGRERKRETQFSIQ